MLDDLEPLDEDEATPEILTAADAGGRLDKWLAERMPGRSRAEVQRWIDAGLVTLAGRPVKASHQVSAGDAFAVSAAPPADYAVAPEPIPLDIIYEDADLLVIDKPAGLVVHPAAGNWGGTLVNAVLHHCPDMAGVGGAGRPGIVHRLDKDTSGLIVVAKNDAAHRALQAQFQDRTVSKLYLALVYGVAPPPGGLIDAPVARNPRDRKRMAVLAGGRPAQTRYEVEAHYRESAAAKSGDARYTLLRCLPLTGRTHQIRVHLAHIGHPIAGDPVYAGRRRPPAALPRQFLHAGGLRFRLPSTGAEVEFVSPLPADLTAYLARLYIS